MVRRSYGLAEDWGRVVSSLEKLAPFYNRFNETISFRTDRTLRRKCVGNKSVQGVVLDAGSGNGIFSKILLENGRDDVEVVLLDVLPTMHKESLKTLPAGKINAVLAAFENMPFREDSFDTVLMGFSLRDARNTESALKEVSRVAKTQGKLLVLDLGKPDDKIKSAFVGLYWRIIAPLIAFIRFGKKGLIASAIHVTYKRLPPNSILRNLTEKYFRTVSLTEKIWGGVIIIEAFR
ncbi:MAG: class I SAM-dependent methyltransferase [Candidatus Caldarchaeum sp.]